MQSYKSLEVYQKSYALTKKVHEITKSLPQYEKHEMGYQVRRSALSITLNIVEGYGRKQSKAEFQHFLRNALGSCNETRVLLDLMRDLEYLRSDEYEQISKEYEILGKQIYRLREAWSQNKKPTTDY